MTEYIVDWTNDYVGFYEVLDKSFVFTYTAIPGKGEQYNYYEAIGRPIAYYNPSGNFYFDKKNIPLVDIREDQFFDDVSEATKLFIKQLFETRIL